MERGTLPRLPELAPYGQLLYFFGDPLRPRGSSVLYRDQTATPAASWHAVLCVGQSAFWLAGPQQRARRQTLSISLVLRR